MGAGGQGALGLGALGQVGREDVGLVGWISD